MELLIPYIPIIILFILFFMKVPVAYSMLFSGLVYFMFINTTLSVDQMVQKLVASMESFPYLAIPFFACAGAVFNYTGITKRIINLARLLVGHIAGGMAHVNILFSVLIGGLSGSANADAAMLTKMVVPEMVKRGYSKGFATALTAASSCIDPMIPPGIILILFAVAADVSVAQIFYAAYVSGFILAAALMIAVYIVAKKRKYAPVFEKRKSMKEILPTLLDASWALFLPFGILMGLRVGMFTPTEAGAVSVVYALLIGIFVYRGELKWKHLPKILVESIEATASVMFIIGAANAFGAYLTWERIPMIVSEALISNITNPYVLLFIINILLLVVGCFFEGGAAMILLAPLLVPAVKALGIDMIHFGIVMCFNLTVAGFTPPFGTMMFVTTSIAKVKLSDYIRECVPFAIALIATLFLITYWPQSVLFLPNLLMK